MTTFRRWFAWLWPVHDTDAVRARARVEVDRARVERSAERIEQSAQELESRVSTNHISASVEALIRRAVR